MIDGLVSDEPTERVAVHEAAMLMDTQPARRRLAAEALEFALSLR